MNCSMGFVDAMGPAPSRARAASKGVEIAFDYAEGLFLEGAQSCVECCQQHDAFQLEIVTGNGERRLVNATAAVSGTNMVTVTPQGAVATGSTIVAVRYAVIDVPQCVIYNSAGIPSNPFVLSVEAAAAEMMSFGLARADSKKVSLGSAEQDPALKLPPMVRLLVWAFKFYCMGKHGREDMSFTLFVLVVIVIHLRRTCTRLSSHLIPLFLFS